MRNARRLGVLPLILALSTLPEDAALLLWFREFQDRERRQGWYRRRQEALESHCPAMYRAVHAVNSSSTAKKRLASGVHSVVTDFLSPRIR